MKTRRTLTRQEILNLLHQHQEALKKYTVKRIGLFGSYATGTQTAKSDIDFLVEFEKPSFDNFMDLSFYLEDLFRKRIELITNGSLSPHIQPYIDFLLERTQGMSFKEPRTNEAPIHSNR